MRKETADMHERNRLGRKSTGQNDSVGFLQGRAKRFYRQRIKRVY